MRQSESHAEYNVAGTPGKRFALLLLTGLSLPAWSDITLSLDGEVNGPVTWGNLPSGSDTRMVPGTISLFPKLAAVLGYVSTGNVTHTEPAGMSFFSSQASGDSLKMGFNNNNATDGVVAVSLPGTVLHY